MRTEDTQRKGEVMGRIGKYESNVKPYIEQIKQWRRNGATDEQICEQLDISKDAFYNYAKKYAEFNDALKKSRADFVNDLKGELARIAFKHELKTTKIYTTVDSEGKEKKHTEVTSKEVDGDIAAIQILLKNLDRDNWADNPQLLKIKQQELELKKMLAEANNFDL